MTAPARALYVTPELVARFAAYYRFNLAWGVLHVSFDDGNYECTVADLEPKPTDRYWHPSNAWSDEERELARIHDLLSPSQRRKLASKAETYENARQARDGMDPLDDPRWPGNKPGARSTKEILLDAVRQIRGEPPA